MMAASRERGFTNLKVEVDNNYSGEEGEIEDSPQDADEEMEEGEAADSEDEVQVNVIIGDTDPHLVPPRRATSMKGGEGRGRRTGVIDAPTLDGLSPRPSSDEGKKDETKSSVERTGSRSRRYGVTHRPKVMTTPKSVTKLYESLDVCDDDFRKGRFRREALHVRGIDNMSTEDIFKYFDGYSPSNIEWIDDSRCNIVWLDGSGPVKALLGLTCPIKPRPADIKAAEEKKSLKKIKIKKEKGVDDEKGKKGSRVKKGRKKEGDDSSSSSSSSDSEEEESSDSSSSSSNSSESSESSSSSNSSSDSEAGTSGQEEKKSKKKKKNKDKDVEMMDQDEPDVQEEECVSADDVAIPVPPGRWRLGVPCPKAKALLFRYAGRNDRRRPSADRSFPSSRKSNTLFGRLSRISESGKRSMQEAQRRREREMEMLRRQRPVYVDLDAVDDESKNPWGSLAKNWGRKESQEDDRLDYQALLRAHMRKERDNGGEIRKNEVKAAVKMMKVGKAPGLDGCHAECLKKGDRKRKRVFSEDEDEYMVYDYVPEREVEEEEELEEGQVEIKDYAMPQSEDTDEDEEDVVSWKSRSKIPRMSMYADAEEKKQTKRKTNDLRSRLSMGRSRQKVPLQGRIGNGKSGTFGREQIDLRTKLSQRRSKIPLSIEVDNERYYNLVASDED
ncbi:uncharacterized protein LOC143025884 isoform X2 [Oratosquilla oratoria]|uniref:uncharacterized protein LOC143025884 isoform X2 n=1 Tax=Oratosquilla oratoria TaxID=337810 RepID=UPI003F774424